MNTDNIAYTPYELGNLVLRNRIVMAPMTRSRASDAELAPTTKTVEYYTQRSGAGLIITEGTQPSPEGQGYTNTPGLHSEAQIEAWRRVTDAVHARGGKIFVQLMHTGRIGHPANSAQGLQPVGPSAVAANGQIFTPNGMADFPTPRELTDHEIEQTITDFATAARNGIAAGFDGVEIHAANGYLPHQFLSVNANRRTDQWGGSAENRIRFALRVSEAVAGAIGPERTGIRLSPGFGYNDLQDDPDLLATYTPLLEGLSKLGLIYLHLIEGPDPEVTRELRNAWSGTFMLNPRTDGPTDHESLRLLNDGLADLISFGALYLANPDLPQRLSTGGPYNTPDPTTFFSGDASGHGYIGYPFLNATDGMR